MRRQLGLAALALFWSRAAAAQDLPPGGALDAVLACRSETDAGARLACFDRTTGALATAQAGGAVVVVDRARVEAARRQAFGFSIPSLADILPAARVGARESEPLKQVEAGVSAARLSRDGKWVLSLDNGSVWRQTDTESVLRPPRAGSRVVIKSAALGSYLLSVDGQRSFRARREE